MAFISDTSTPKSAGSFAFVLPAQDCTIGYLQWTPLPKDKIAGPKLLGTTLRAERTLPTRLPTNFPYGQGIYSIEIATPGPLPEVYIGKGASLRGRLADYVEMTRRLLGLYFGHPMWASDGNGFRYVHYRIADALLAGRAVTFNYLPLINVLNSHQLRGLELLEISSAVMAYPHSTTAPSPLNLNACDSFKSAAHRTGLSPPWATVHAIL